MYLRLYKINANLKHLTLCQIVRYLTNEVLESRVISVKSPTIILESKRKSKQPRNKIKASSVGMTEVIVLKNLQ